ncbi:hypothetical protein O7623_23485 [Solwaraspora sp. WMMD791]|uniref:hypothetical protein n=1 Tax=Solwaraspora sp. WMMD791 TaxID=3016086 RepID=UPI002499CB15|nr:hypothetical protein [Solwaraspora sp. WMMD791]WFE30870.1 hypothetical protein O7623_23485 [Solwaraspora sp. WMMD791]
MTPSTRGYRRVTVLFTGAAAASALLLSGCGTGQIAETAIKSASINGVNVDSPDGTVSLRDLSVPYPGVEGYPAGSSAPVEVAIFNNTNDPVTVTVSVAGPGDSDRETVIGAASVVIGGSDAEPSPQTTDGTEPTGQPAADPGRDARISLPANGWALFSTDDTEPLRVTGLTDTLTAGRSVNLVFEFDNGNERLVVPAPVDMPLTPVPRAPAEHDEEEH